MKKYGVLILVAASLIIIALQFRTTSRLRAELAAAREENGRLPQEASSQSASDQAAGAVEQTRSSSSSENKTEAQTKQVQELETEVMRLRGAASRALRAEAEVAQLRLGSVGGSTRDCRVQIFPMLARTRTFF